MDYNIMSLEDFKQLKRQAVPDTEEDYGSARQIEAEQRFFDAVEKAIGDTDYKRLTSIINDGYLDIYEALELALNSVAFGLDFAIEKFNPN